MQASLSECQVANGRNTDFVHRHRSAANDFHHHCADATRLGRALQGAICSICGIVNESAACWPVVCSPTLVRLPPRSPLVLNRDASTGRSPMILRTVNHFAIIRSGTLCERRHPLALTDSSLTQAKCTGPQRLKLGALKIEIIGLGDGAPTAENPAHTPPSAITEVSLTLEPVWPSADP